MWLMIYMNEQNHVERGLGLTVGQVMVGLFCNINSFLFLLKW